MALPYVNASGGGIQDDAAALQASIDAVANAGGGLLLAEPGARYRVTKAPIIREGVHLNLQQATISQELGASTGEDAHGARLMSRAALGNGTVETLSSNASNLEPNASYHAAVSIGPGYGTGGTVANPSPHDSVYGWHLYRLKMSTDKDIIQPDGRRIGGVAVQLCGGVNHGLIEWCEVPDSAVMAGGIHADWGYLGPIIKTDRPADMATNKSNWFAGNLRTTHPYQVTIRHNHIGRLTKPQVDDLGSHGVRLSGTFGFDIHANTIDYATFIALFNHGGDMGPEFSRVQDRPFILSGNRWTWNVVKRFGKHGIVTDSYGDNVYRAVLAGYDKILEPIQVTNQLFDSNMLDGGGEGGLGILAHYMKGGTIRRTMLRNCAQLAIRGPEAATVKLEDNWGSAGQDPVPFSA